MLALIGLLGGIALVGAGRGGVRAEQSEAMRLLEQRLLEARADAMLRSRVTAVIAAFDGVELRMSGTGRTESVPAPGLFSVGEDAMTLDRLEVRFASDGRADTLGWRIVDERVDRQRVFDLGLLDAGRLIRSEGEAATAGIGGRLWLFRFDPVSGAPGVEALAPE